MSTGIKKKDRSLKEQIITGIHDYDMMIENIRELIEIEKTNEIFSEQVLAWSEK